MTEMVTLSAAQYGNEVVLRYAHKNPSQLDLIRMAELLERTGAQCREVARKMPGDGRDPDYSRDGVFQTHNCYRCKSGALPCAKGNPRDCDSLIARND